MLRDFIAANREEILARARLRVSSRSAPGASDVELTRGLPVFLEQLSEALRKSSAAEDADHTAMKESAGDHGDILFDQGLTAEQVVHDYGDLCQVITGLAVEQRSAIPARDFQVFNLCLDDAIAGAVTAYSARRERTIAAEDTERLGVIAHEMSNVLNAALLSFASIRKGTVAPGGSTGAMLERNLLNLQTL
ncbi:MAG: sensor histidine kinase, partial [Polyangiales bacterium]